MTELKKMLIPILAIVALIGIAIYVFEDLNRKDSSQTTRESNKSKRVHRYQKNGAKKNAVSNERKAEMKKRLIRKEMFEHLSGEDRKLANTIQDALDNEDFEATSKLANEALKSDNAEVRQHAVEALGWFGEQALPELTAWMSDPDEDVAQAAMSQWSSALSEVEKPLDRFNIAFAAFQTISDADNLETIGQELSNTASELIDGEDNEKVASQRRVEIVQLLAETIIDGAEKNSAAAREAYEDITGNSWISVEEAEKYLQDPENYEAPESDNESNDDA